MSEPQKSECAMPERRSGESDDSYFRRVRDWISGVDVRSKTDLNDWTGSPPFHLNRERS